MRAAAGRAFAAPGAIAQIWSRNIIMPSRARGNGPRTPVFYLNRAGFGKGQQHGWIPRVYNEGQPRCRSNQ
jgi:hypothetical protein